MHNRARMITASFLVKDLHMDWRLGEKYFAQNLVDYDPCVNNGNWQWSASVGCDPQVGFFNFIIVPCSLFFFSPYLVAGCSLGKISPHKP